jgi:hypothetical protein
MAAQKFAEVVGNPYDVWVAAAGTAFPAIDAVPGGGWTKFGTNGSQNQASKGVTVNIAETINSFRPAGDTLIVKDWRTAEDPNVQFGLVDTTVETLSQILQNATITTVAATTALAGQKSIKLKQGFNVTYFALLVRGLSPYDDGTGLNCQWEFTRVAQTGSQAITYVAGTPAEVDCEFSIRGDVTGQDPAIYRAQTGAHL